MEPIFVELRRKPVSFSTCHFWIEFRVQHSSLLFLKAEKDSMLEPCLFKWKVYVIHHFGATIIKLQGTIFLFPSTKNFLSKNSSLQFKTSLGFSCLFWLLPDLSIVLDAWYKNLLSDYLLLFCIYLPLLFSPWGNLLDHDSISFQTLLCANNLYSKIPWHLKEITIIILKLHASC